MKDQVSITISDVSGSRYYTFHKSTRKRLILAALALLLVLTASLAGNVRQYEKVVSLAETSVKLDAELTLSHIENTNLERVIANQDQRFREVSDELVEIERVSGVNSYDSDVSIRERVRLIGRFYNEKEAEYLEIGNRVDHIEGIIGMNDAEHPAANPDLFSRVELAELGASQERILHDSVPSGYPTKRTRVTSGFGMRKHPVTGINAFHSGIDLRTRIGDPVYATADGFVSKATFTQLSGNLVGVFHNYGFETRYSHLDKIAVSPGQVVNKGDLVGYAGNTGRSTAPHLHYEVRYLGKAINPWHFLQWEFGSNEIFTEVRGIAWPSLISLINKQIIHQTSRLSQLEHTSPER